MIDNSTVKILSSFINHPNPSEHHHAHLSHSTQNWMMPNHLYEAPIFYYVLIIAYWVIIEGISLYFEIGDFSLQTNLLFNFIWYLVLYSLMIVDLIFFYHAYEVAKYQKHPQNLEFTSRF